MVHLKLVTLVVIFCSSPSCYAPALKSVFTVALHSGGVILYYNKYKVHVELCTLLVIYCTPVYTVLISQFSLEGLHIQFVVHMIALMIPKFTSH